MKEVRKLQVGVGTEAGTAIGPLINQAALQKVEAHVKDAQAKGASIACGGKASERGSQFFEPTVLTEASGTMVLAHEETFGPVAALFRFDTESDVVDLANDSPYGLAAYVFSNDVSRLFRVSESLEYGMVGMNTGAISTAVAPFGGVKESGTGREGSLYGIEEFLETQTLHLDLAKAA